MQVFKTDENGFYVEPVIININEEITSNLIEIRPSNGLYRAKWTGAEWIEDMTQAEIDELNKTAKMPTQDEYLIDLDYRLCKMEMGV